MWQSLKSEPVASADQGNTTNSERIHHRHTFVRSTFAWCKVGPYGARHEKWIKDFEHKDFCAVNRATASEARGPTSAVLLQSCAEVWENDPIPLESLCRVRTHWAAGTASEQQSTCFARIEAMVQNARAAEVWHMPLDDKTVDDARRHCGMPVGDLDDTARQAKDDLEIALMCERSATSDAPHAIKTAITRFCQETKPNAEAVIRRMAQEARAGDFTVTCLSKRLGLLSLKTQ